MGLDGQFVPSVAQGVFEAEQYAFDVLAGTGEVSLVIGAGARVGEYGRPHGGNAAGQTSSETSSRYIAVTPPQPSL